MDEITQQKIRLQRLIASGTIEKATLAKRCGLHRNALQHILEDDWNPTVRVLSALVRAADAMGFPRRPRRARGNDRDGLAA